MFDVYTMRMACVIENLFGQIKESYLASLRDKHAFIYPTVGVDDTLPDWHTTHQIT